MNWEVIYKYRWQLSLLLVGLIFSITGLIMTGFWGKSSPAVEIISEEAEAQTLKIVEVSGAVNSPGVYEFDSQARVADALDRAGGVSDGADAAWLEKNLNRAALLQDGQKLYIPRIGEQSEAVSATNMAGGSGGSDTVLSVSSQRVNINTASQKELEELWGIGPVTAQNIIEQRPYSSVEELLQKGILKSNVYERNASMLSIY